MGSHAGIMLPRPLRARLHDVVLPIAAVIAGSYIHTCSVELAGEDVHAELVLSAPFQSDGARIWPHVLQ